MDLEAGRAEEGVKAEIAEYLKDLKNWDGALRERLCSVLVELENFDSGKGLPQLSGKELEDLGRWEKDVTNLIEFLIANGMKEYVDHDLGSLTRHFASNLHFFIEDYKEIADRANTEIGSNDLKPILEELGYFINHWDRLWIALEDVADKRISDTKVVDREDFDVGLFERLADYFAVVEMRELRDKAQQPGSQYSDLIDVSGGLTKKFTNQIDFRQLNTAMADKKIEGNNGLIFNFIFNALRNGLKNDSGAKNVELDAFVDGNELVIRMMDDGKGIDAASLDPTNERFIFDKKDLTGDAATPENKRLGLHNFNKRIESIGGTVGVISFRNNENKVNDYQPLDRSLSLEEINKLRAEAGKAVVNTIFEVRLPLQDK